MCEEANFEVYKQHDFHTKLHMKEFKFQISLFNITVTWITYCINKGIFTEIYIYVCAFIEGHTSKSGPAGDEHDKCREE